MLQYLPDAEAINLHFSGLEASVMEGGELATAKLNLVRCSAMRAEYWDAGRLQASRQARSGRVLRVHM